MVLGLRTSPDAPRADHVLACEVASDRCRYGHLVALRPEDSSFEPSDRSVLDSYARLAASALDSEVAVVEARRQADDGAGPPRPFQLVGGTLRRANEMAAPPGVDHPLGR